MSALAALALASGAMMTFPFQGCQTLAPKDTAAVATLATALRNPSLAGVRLVVEGHAARTGDGAEEDAVSETLANDIADRLVSQGVPRDRLSVRSYGAGRPTAATLPEDYDNCRVEVARL